MPTTRARHLLTETDDIAAAIETAIERYPHETRAGALRRLVLAGADALASEQQRHRATVLHHAAGFPGVYRRGELDELREEWPT